MKRGGNATLLWSSSSSYAVATLLYDSSFVDGVVVLGRSLVRHQRDPTVEMVALVTAEVWREAKAALRSERWRLVEVSAVASPAPRVSSDRLRFAYTKLAVFNLTRYDRVAYIDADAVVLGDVGELFACAAEFCAVLRHCELFNTGVFVVRPSARLANDVARKASSTFSYTGGDQGFLNAYFRDFERCPYFSSSDTKDNDYVRCRRLPATYNGDWPLLFAQGGGPQKKNKAAAGESRDRKIRVQHMTLGSVKPWTWSIAPFFPTVAAWQSYSTARVDLAAASTPTPAVAACVLLCAIFGRPLRRRVARSAVSLGLLAVAARTAAFAGSRRASAASIWTAVALWFCVAYLASFAAYVAAARRKTFPAHLRGPFLAFSFAFVGLVAAFLAAPTLFLFGSKDQGDVASLLVLLLPILYLFLVLNTAAAVLFIPGGGAAAEKTNRRQGQRSRDHHARTRKSSF